MTASWVGMSAGLMNMSYLDMGHLVDDEMLDIECDDERSLDMEGWVQLDMEG
jgi:hypothetical protein